MRRLILAAIVAGVFRPAHAEEATVQDLLRRAGEYVMKFETGFVSVLTDEVYDQDDSWPGSKIHRRRQIRSEMLFMQLPAPQVSWLSVRNILEVDGKPVPDSRDRLDRALAGDREGLVGRMRAVRDEGARFNVGTIERNIGDPILPLLFVDPEYQWRFDFTLGPGETLEGTAARRLRFREIYRPTIIRQGTGDLATSGSLWIDPASGTVLQTELTAMARRTQVFDITVRYHRDPRLEVWIPARMTEVYRQHNNVEVIFCSAAYSNPRRFETSGRVVR